MLQLQQVDNEIERLGLHIAVVSFETPKRAQAYHDETRLRWPVLVDQARKLYTAYGMYEGSLWSIWGPKSWAAYSKLMLHGRLPRRPTDNTSQLGGDVLIDPEGVVRFHHISSGPADRPAVSEILALAGT